MNNQISLSSNMQASQQVQNLIKLKVQLTKQKSKIQGFKEMENSYKKLSIKSEAIQKQLAQQHKIMENFFEKLNKIMYLLQIDYVGIFGTGNSDNSDQIYTDMNWTVNQKKNQVNENNIKFLNDSSQKLKPNQSISFINLNPSYDENPSLMRKINKLNSLKSISRDILPPNHIQFTQENAKFYLIEYAIKSLVNSNQQYKLNLQKYERLSQNIEINTKQQQLIMKRLEAQIRLKDKEIEERDCQITQLSTKIQDLNNQLKEKQQIITKLQKQHKSIVKTYEELQGKIYELKNQNSIQEQKRYIIRNNCHQLLEELKITDQTYLKNYFLQQNLKHSPKFFHPKANSPFYYNSNPLVFCNNKPEFYSQSEKHHKFNTKKLITQNKYDFVFD